MALDLEAELAEETGEWPDAWRPRENAVLIGTVRKYSTGESAYGPVRTVIVERPDGSRASLWLSSKVLLSLFEQQRPLPGEKIGIRCHGKHPEKGYWRFTLIVDRPETPLSFEPLGGETDSPPQPVPPRETPRDQRTPAPGRTTDRQATPYASATVRGLRTAAPTIERPTLPGDDDDPFAFE